MDVVCAQLRSLRSEMGGLSAQHAADVVKEEQRVVELEQWQVDLLRAEAELRACLLEVDQLKGDGSAKDDKLKELAGVVAAKKLLCEKAVWDYVLLSTEGDKLRGRLAEA